MATRPHPRPQANIREINQILGNARVTKSGIINVGGVNPEKLTCDELLVRGYIRLVGGMGTSLSAINGALANTAIRFAHSSPNTGIYSPAPDRICTAILGTPIMCCTSTGLAVPYIYSPTGIIDFGGSTLTNFTTAPNPNAYTLIGTKVQTVGAATAIALVVPLTCATTTCAWELTTKVEYTSVTDDPDARDNGTYTFRIRAWNPNIGPPFAQLAISAQYDITRYHTPSFVGISVTAVVVGTNVNIQVRGVGAPAPLTINWVAKCDIVKIDTP